MAPLILILGGARSGKSAYAQRLALELGGDRVVFVATAQAGDADMAQRIARHRQERPAAWRTLEAPQHVGHAIRPYVNEATVVLLDCLTLLVSNVLLAAGTPAQQAEAQAEVQDEVSALLHACQESSSTLIVVSNEVGLGVVPDTPLGRVYRDVLGHANQLLARQAQSVYLLVAGLPVDIKALSARK